MARKKKEASAPSGCPAWLATYGDMVTLVLTFFVLLYSFSTIDAAKWQNLVTSLTGKTPSYVNNAALNIPNPPAVVNQPSPDAGIEASDQSWSELFDSMVKFFQTRSDAAAQSGQSKPLPDMIQLDTQIIITLTEKMLFDPGSYRLRPDAAEDFAALMDEIRPQLGIVRQVVVEGHTDTVPVNIDSVIRDNMDLGYQRAYAVRDALLKSDLGLPESMFACRSMGEDYPYCAPGEEYTGDPLDGDAYREWVDAHNATSEQRQSNRRCVIIIERVQTDE